MNRPDVLRVSRFRLALLIGVALGWVAIELGDANAPAPPRAQEVRVRPTIRPVAVRPITTFSAAPPREVEPGPARRDHRLWLQEIAAARAALRLRLDETPGFPQGEALVDEDAWTRALADALIGEYLVRRRALPADAPDGTDGEPLRAAARENARAEASRSDGETRAKLLEWSLAALD